MLMSGKLIGYANPPTSPSRSLKRPDTHIQPFVSRHFCASSSVKQPLTCALHARRISSNLPSCLSLSMTTIPGLPTIRLLRNVARTTSSVDQWLFGCRVLAFSEPLGIAAGSRYRHQA